MDSDKKLLDEFRKGDINAFSSLYEKYWERLYFVAYQKLYSQEEVEDLIHDLFIELWNRRESIQINKSFSGYLFTALKYKIFRLYDSKAIRKKYAEEYSKKSVVHENSVEEYATFNELFEFIEEKIEKLPKKCRIVFKLSRFKNYSVKEISRKLGISTNTAQNHINTANKHLRFKINELLLALIIIIS